MIDIDTQIARLEADEARREQARARVAEQHLAWAREQIGAPAGPLGLDDELRIDLAIDERARTWPSWSAPIGDFKDPLDWREQRVEEDESGRLTLAGGGPHIPVDFAVERRVPGLVAEADAMHSQDHGDASHPWCASCEVRLARSHYDFNDRTWAGWTDSEIREYVAETTAARCRATLLRTRGAVPDATPPAPRADVDTWRLQSVDELRSQAAPEMLVDGVLPAKSYGVLSGRDATYKTFLALDMACALASGRETWRGRDVGADEPATVYLLAGEGAGQIPARVDAWAGHHGVDVADLEDTLKILPRVPDLYAGGPGFEAVLAQAAVDKPVLIIVDTMRRASGAADQNSAKEMGMVVDRCHGLQEASGGTVLVIAHTDKGDNDTRGSSSIEDDADFVLHVKRKEEPLRQELAVTKMKDGPDDFTSTSYPVTVGDSIVLSATEHQQGVLWSSRRNRSRVIGALRTLEPQGWASQSDIVAVTGADGDEALHKGTVSKELNALIKEGGATAHPKLKQYRITPGWAEPLPTTTQED